MSSFDPLPHAPLPMPKQTLESPGTLKSTLARFFALFVRSAPPPVARREF